MLNNTCVCVCVCAPNRKLAAWINTTLSHINAHIEIPAHLSAAQVESAELVLQKKIFVISM